MNAFVLVLVVALSLWGVWVLNNCERGRRSVSGGWGDCGWGDGWLGDRLAHQDMHWGQGDDDE